MKAPINWLKDFTDIDVEPKVLADKMTISGSKVEEVIVSGEDIQGVYTGKIIACEDHPDSDHLHIVTVDLGNDELGRSLQIVCGAPNVYVGMICPVATVGAHLPGDIVIKKGKLRGVESNGMCCSIDELGVPAEGHEGADEYGLWNMPKDTPLGVDIKKVLGLGNVTIDFEITSNRPDCFSIEGLGREAAITLGKAFRPCQPKLKIEGNLDINDIAKVDILAPDLCYRYCSRIIEDVKIGPSPAWMAERLTDAGMRPINNIVDITNYVCLELGQPMHAFDLDYLSGKHIIVRKAEEGEIIKTLDGVERKLDPSMLVIADETKACAIAGVMGGENSEVIPETKAILFESAVFNEVSVRKTALKNTLRTEASSRYEKGLDPENAIRALDRACELVELLGAGKVSKGVIDNYPTKREVKKIKFRPERINSFIGIKAEESFMRDILGQLGCTISDDNIITPPTYRPDLISEADISEEIARFYDYNNIEPTLLSGKDTTLGGRTYAQQATEDIKNIMVNCGFYEAITFSFESPSDLDLIRTPDNSILRNQIKISNPLGDDSSVMRTSMLPSILRIAGRNNNRSVPEASVFEVAYIYLPDEDPFKLPEERQILSGFRYNSAGIDSKEAFFEVKGSIEEICAHLGIKSLVFEACSDDPSYHPGRCALVSVAGKVCGKFGVIHPQVADNFDCPKGTVAFEIEVAKLIAASKPARTYKQLPKFPGITRDLAMVVDKSVPVGDILRTAKSAGGNLLESVEFFDVFEGAQLGENKKSVAISLLYRSPEKTLSDDDIKDSVSKILSRLESNFGAALRQ